MADNWICGGNGNDLVKQFSSSLLGEPIMGSGRRIGRKKKFTESSLIRWRAP